MCGSQRQINKRILSSCPSRDYDEASVCSIWYPRTRKQIQPWILKIGWSSRWSTKQAGFPLLPLQSPWVLDPAVTGAHRARALPTETVPPRWISGSPPAADSTRRGATKSTPTAEEGRGFWCCMTYLMAVMHCLRIHATNMGWLLNSKEQRACTETILFAIENWVWNLAVGFKITIQLFICEMFAFCSPWFDLEHTRAALNPPVHDFHKPFILFILEECHSVHLMHLWFSLVFIFLKILTWFCDALYIHPIISNTINTFCNCTVPNWWQRCSSGTSGFLIEVAEEAALRCLPLSLSWLVSEA